MLQRERFQNNFDFLRIFAALCVTFSHSFSLLKSSDNQTLLKLVNEQIHFSFIGLSIFFSISGYLIAKSAAGSSSLKNYLWKRFLRIQPLLVLVCLVTIFFIAPLSSTLAVESYFKQPSVYTYFRNVMPVFGIQFFIEGVFANNPVEAGINGSLWTLIIEERLYLLIGLFAILKGIFKPFFLISILLMNLLYLIHNFFDPLQLYSFFDSIATFYAIIFLNAAGFLLLKINFTSLARSKYLVIIILSLIALCYLVIFRTSLQTILIPFIVLTIAQKKNFLNRAGKYGDITYGIYILSFPVHKH